jgi:hypothetical protein
MIAVYNSDELDTDEGEGGTNNVDIKGWLVEGKKQLDTAREVLHYLCEPVPPPREVEQFLRYFCGDANDPDALNKTEPLRIAFYKSVVVFLRAYAAIAGNLIEAGYTDADALQQETAFYTDIRAAIKQHSGEELDIKPYEADMRHSDEQKRAAVIHEWHKSLLHEAVPPIIRKWEPKLGVNVAGYFLQRMKTKWGSCNHRAGHIRINTELVKKPKDLLEYVIGDDPSAGADAQRAFHRAAERALSDVARGSYGAERAATCRGEMEGL